MVGTTTGASNDFSGFPLSCQSFGAAPDRVYRVSVPAGQRLFVQAATTFDSTINLIADLSSCGSVAPDGGARAIQCVAGRDQPDDAPTGWDNTGTTARDVFIVIDGYATGAGAFTLSVSLTPIPPGDTCNTAESLPVGTASAQSLTSYLHNSVFGACLFSSGPDRFYSTIIPANSRLTVDVTSAQTDGGVPFQPMVNIVGGSCTFLQCLFGASASMGSNRVVTSYDNVSSAPLPVTVVVDSQSANASGTFTLVSSLASVSLPPGDVCSNASVAPTVPTTATFAGYTNHYDGFAAFSCGYVGGPDRAFSVSVPPGQVMTARATSASNMALSIVRNVQSCAMGPCLRNADLTSSGTETVSFTNQDPDGGVIDLLVVVDSASSTPPSASWDFSATLSAPVAADNCFVAGPPLTPPVSLAAQTTAGFTNAYQGSCLFRSGPDRVWAIDVPASSQLTVTTTGADLSLNLFASLAECSAATTCLAQADNFGMTDVLTWTNRGGPQVVYLAVDSYSAATFGLSVALSSVTVPQGETCFSAGAPITMSTMRTGQTLMGYSNDYAWNGPGCVGFGLSGPDRVYPVQLAPGQRLRAVLSGASFDATLLLSTSCPSGTSGSCLAGVDTGSSGQPETLSWTNTGTTTVTAFLVVDTWAQTPGTFDLSLTIDLPVLIPGETCQSAEALVLPAMVASQSTAGFVNDIDVASSCVGFTQPGPERVYSVSVPSGHLLTVVMTPVSFDGALYVVDQPASSCQASGTACLAGSDRFGGSAAETATWRNVTGMSRTVFIVVDSYSSTLSGSFSLSAVSQP